MVILFFNQIGFCNLVSIVIIVIVSCFIFICKRSSYGLSNFKRSDVLPVVNSQPDETDPLNRLGSVDDLIKYITCTPDDGNGFFIKN